MAAGMMMQESGCQHNWIMIDAYHEAVGYYAYWSCTKCFVQEDVVHDAKPAGFFKRLVNWIKAIWRSYD